MSYLVFLILFLGLPIAGAVRRLRRTLWSGFWGRLGVVCAAAVAYATPWSNYLVATRVWYYDPALLLGFSIAYVPVEEHVFFALQVILVGLFTLGLWRRFYPADFETGAEAAE